jgi:signal transduction histidine kinase
VKAILSKPLILLFFFAAVFLTGSAAVCHHAVRVLSDNEQWVIHSHEILARLESIRAALAMAEGDQRNFLFTGQTDYLDTWQSTGRRCADDVDELTGLVTDNVDQTRREVLLRTSVTDRLAALARGVVEYQSGGIDAARAWTATGSGRRAMETAMGLIASMEQEENHLLAVRSSQSDANLRHLVITFALVGLLSVTLLGIIFFFVRREVQHRAEAARQIKQSETRLLLAIEAAELGIWEHDLVTGQIISSERCQAMFALPLDQPVTVEAIGARIHAEDRKRFQTTVQDAINNLAGRGEYFIEYRVCWPDQSVRWIRVRGRVVFEGSGAARRALRIVGTMIDVSDARQAESDLREAKNHAEAANRAKDQFLAVLSHELRTPLTPVLAAISGLEQRADLPAGIRDDVATVRRNVELEARLIDDLLDLTRIARGKVRLHPEVVDIHELIRVVLAMFRSQADEAALRIRLDLGAAQHHVWGDPGRLQQILWNLLSNAVKFTPAGGTISVRTHNDENQILVVEVEDTGIGIEPEGFSKLFNAFEQGDATLARKFGGLGLGLSIAKTIAELHRGQLEAFSTGKDKGTTFRFKLTTVQPPSDIAGAPVQARSNVEPPRSPQVRILLVEDNEDTRRLMGRLLRMFGHHVEAADCVASALDLARKESFDLLVSDIGLPDGTGWELMVKLGEHRPAKAIALSGFGMEDDLRRSREAGYLEHLTKPINLTQLREVIDRVIAA